MARDWTRNAVELLMLYLVYLGGWGFLAGLAAVTLSVLTGSDYVGAWGVVGISYGAVVMLSAMAVVGFLGRRH